MATKKKSNAGRKPTGAGEPFPCRVRGELIEKLRQLAADQQRTIRATSERVIEAGLEVAK